MLVFWFLPGFAFEQASVEAVVLEGVEERRRLHRGGVVVGKEAAALGRCHRLHRRRTGFHFQSWKKIGAIGKGRMKIVRISS